MKALSLLQPYATLIVLGAKRYETRGWDTKQRGRILIHSSLGKKEEYKNLCMQEPFRKYIGGLQGFYDLPFGAIIGEAQLEYTVATENVRAKLQGTDEYHFGDYSTGRFAYRFTNPIMYKSPIPYKGSLSFWDFPDHLLTGHL